MRTATLMPVRRAGWRRLEKFALVAILTSAWPWRLLTTTDRRTTMEIMVLTFCFVFIIALAAERGWR